MNAFEAIVLGVVEGVTEYLPVSSTGHLILAQRALGIPEDRASNAYAICIQSGAILAVVGLYWRRMIQMARGVGNYLVHRNTDDGFRLAINIGVAFFPAAIVGLLLDDWIEEVLFSLWFTVLAWFVGGVAILVISRHHRQHGGQHRGDKIFELTWRGALVIGLIQCIAMWPGTSRSLVTIVGGVMVGLSLTAAVEFSFLLGVVTLLAATVYKMKDAGPVMLETYGWGPMILGSVAAFIAALLAVKWMVSYLSRNGLEWFGYYRIGLAAIVAVALWSQWIQA